MVEMDEKKPTRAVGWRAPSGAEDQERLWQEMNDLLVGLGKMHFAMRERCPENLEEARHYMAHILTLVRRSALAVESALFEPRPDDWFWRLAVEPREFMSPIADLEGGADERPLDGLGAIPAVAAHGGKDATPG
ncbi:hypothetical protein [Paracidovorax cattleyae]|uniref:Uncharacterized protein n=1 Tax=Paracidovorax cattleyae TaxID=80868 RepID=A0A1H0RG14_9BURK|nr:hypothetical protein [Paracidovorax cattleyae]SDP28330.1 hypothetical protein SAMN04489708_11043 [Paracidovorax cattleyae]